MKKTILRFAVLLLCTAFSAVSCQEKDLDCMDLTSLRVAVTPEPGTIAAAGATFTSSVVVNQGNSFEVAWEVSVDNAPSWVKVEKTSVSSHFTGTYDGDDKDYDVAAVKVTVSANTSGAKRLANLRFTVADGSSITYTINQAAK